MSDIIFSIDTDVTSNSLSLKKMTNRSYISEDAMQQLVADFPELLPGDQINSLEPRRWLLVGREVGIPSEEGAADNWAIDVLLVDQDAVLTLVEVKLDTNYDIRRRVTGQALEYAAHAVDNWKIETLIGVFERTWEQKDRNPYTELENFLGNEEQINKFWELAESNLRAGKIRILFVANQFPDSLKRVIKFLNRQMVQAEVFGVELLQFESEKSSAKTVVARVTGQLERAVIPTPSRSQWDEKKFFEYLAASNGPDVAHVAGRILLWVKQKQLKIEWGSGATTGSLIPKVRSRNGERQIFTMWTDGRINFYFSGGSFYDVMPPFHESYKREELVGKLNKLLNHPVPLEEARKGMWIDLSALKDEDKLLMFLSVMESVVAEVEKARA